MIDPGALRAARQKVESRKPGLRDGPRPGWPTELISNHTDLLAGRRQAQHGLDEVSAKAPHDPCRSQHNGPAASSQNGLLTRQFRCPIDRPRAGRVIFLVGPIQKAIEHIVGGIVDEADVLRRTGTRHLAWSVGVKLEGLSLFLLGPVNGCIGCSIDHGAGFDLSDQSAGVATCGQI